MTDSSDFPADDSLARLMPRTKAEQRILKWFVPDLSLALVFLILLYALFVLQAQTELLRDSDTGWHIRTGERILAGQGIPRTDPYSFTKSGEPWRAWEWGSEAVMGLLHERAGLRGVVWCSLVVIGLAIWLSLRLTWLTGGDFLLAGLILPGVISSSATHWLARPHMLSWIWLILTVMALESWSGRVRLRHGVVAFLMGILWANTHASFTLGLGTVLLYVAGGFLSPFIWRDSYNSRVRLHTVLFSCGLAGTFVNPFGWTLHSHTLSYLVNRDLLGHIREFQTYNFHSEGAWMAIAVFIYVGAGACCALVTRNLPRSLLQAAFLVMALRAARGIPLLGFAAVPLANSSLLAALCKWDDLGPLVKARLRAVLQYSGNLRAIDQYFGGWALMPAMAAALWALLGVPQFARTTGFDKKVLPVEAAEHVKDLPEQARILSTDQYGGYLIYRYEGSRKVYFDGRSDFYGLDYVKKYVDLISVKPGWQETIREYRFTHALLPRDRALRAVLESAGWRTLHSDKVAVLLAHPDEGQASAPTPR